MAIQESSPEFERLVQAELEQMQASDRSEASFEELANRFVVRTARICGGVVLGLIAWWLFSLITDISDKPFGAMTLRDLGGALAGGIFGCYAVLGAFQLAFGEGEKTPPLRNRAIEKVRIQIAQQEIQAKEESERVKAEQEQLRWYRYGRLIGALFDPGLTARKPWLGVIVLIAGGLVIALVVWAVTGFRH